MPMIESLGTSLAVGVSVGTAAAYLGSLMITRRMALVGDALGHVALPGMGLAILLGVNVSLGAFAFLVAGTLLIWKLGKWTTLSAETLVGIVFVSSLALGFLIVPQPDLLESLIGDISSVSSTAMLASVLFSGLAIYLVRRLYRGIMLLNLSPELAVVEGIQEDRHNLLYLLSIALVVSLGIKVTGSLLVGALVIIPPSSARVLTSSLGPYGALSMLIGALSCLIGILLSHMIHFPAGPAIILVNAVLFVAALAWRRLKSQAQ